MEDALSQPQKYLRVVSQLATSGALGVALLLGAAPPAAAAPEPLDRQPASAERERVSERLSAIREAVSALAAEQQTAEPLGGLRLAWHNWGNRGWRHPWANWGGGHPWGNHGYRPWNNWNNWSNGWNNWRNGWGNWRR
jgi:rSAM-associated Gly-rich repeat protein